MHSDIVLLFKLLVVVHFLFIEDPSLCSACADLINRGSVYIAID